MMFWFMFAEDTLSSFEQHMMGGIQVDGDAQPLLRRLSADFPNIRITNLEHQIAGIRDIMIALTRLMNATLLLLLAGALIVIIATSFVSSVNRTEQMQLMRALGLRRSQCYVMQISEYGVIGLSACVVGIVGTQLIGSALFKNLFAVTYQPDWNSAFLLTIAIGALFSAIGSVFAFSQLRKAVTLR